MTTTLHLGHRYQALLEGLTYYSRGAEWEYPLAALIEFAMIDDGGEIVPEVIAVHWDKSIHDPHGLYEAEARAAFYEDWKAGHIRPLGDHIGGGDD